MKSLNIKEMPENLHASLKIMAIRRKTKLYKLIIEILTEYVKKEREVGR